MNTTSIVAWLEERQFCISLLYLIPCVFIAVLFLIFYTYYCYLSVCECRRKAQLAESETSHKPQSSRRPRLSTVESIRQMHQRRQTELY